jgi:hypothetical protein
MANEVDFEQVLKLFESHGWRLKKIYEPYRVFVKEGQLPWLIPVKDRKVDIEYVHRFKKFVEEQGQN